MSRRYVKVADGEWVQPIRRGYRMMCCDCGLVHRITFRYVVKLGVGPKGWVEFHGGKIQFQAFRDARATAARRRRKKT